MTDIHDEFRLLPGKLEQLGLAGPIPPVRRTNVELGSATVSALLWAEQPEMLFLHGGGLNAHTWDATVLALGRPAIAVDLPGHGESTWRDDLDYSPATNAVAVATVLDRVAADTAQHIVGQSLGGLTGIALLDLRPELVRSLVIVDISPGILPEDSRQVRDFLAGPQVFSSRDEIVEKAFAAGIGSSREELERGVIHNTRVRADGSIVFRHHLANLEPGQSLNTGDFTTLWPTLERSTVPVLLVRGSRGFLSPPVVAEFAERVPRATILELDAGHNVHTQQPVALADAIREFHAASQAAA